MILDLRKRVHKVDILASKTPSVISAVSVNVFFCLKMFSFNEVSLITVVKCIYIVKVKLTTFWHLLQKDYLRFSIK